MTKRTVLPSLIHPCPRPPHTVLFDLDGTLIDSAAVIAQSYNRGLQATGHRLLPNAEILAMLGPTLENLYAKRIPASDVPAACAAYRNAFAELYPVYVRASSGAVSLLTALRAAGVRTAVVTNRGRHTDELLRQCELLGLLDTIVAVPDGPYAPKPDPEMLYVAMDKLDAIPDETCYVGDSLDDMRAGSAAHLWNVGLMTLGLDSAALEGAGAHVVATDLTALPAVLGLEGAARTGVAVKAEAAAEALAAPATSDDGPELRRPPYMMPGRSADADPAPSVTGRMADAVATLQEPRPPAAVRAVGQPEPPAAPAVPHPSDSPPPYAPPAGSPAPPGMHWGA